MIPKARARLVAHRPFVWFVALGCVGLPSESRDIVFARLARVYGFVWKHQHAVVLRCVTVLILGEPTRPTSMVSSHRVINACGVLCWTLLLGTPIPRNVSVLHTIHPTPRTTAPSPRCNLLHAGLFNLGVATSLAAASDAVACVGWVAVARVEPPSSTLVDWAAVVREPKA